MPLRVSEVLPDRAARIRGDVLHGSGVAGRGGDDNRVLHGPNLLERFHYLCNRGTLLPDCNVYANNVLTLLIDDGVQSNSGLSGLAIANDQLALPAADRDHRIDRLDSCLKRL